MAACVREGEPISLADAYADPRFDSAHDKASGYRTASILCVPVKAEGKVVGAVQFLNKSGGKPFSDDDLRAAKMLATHVAIFLSEVLDDS